MKYLCISLLLIAITVSGAGFAAEVVRPPAPVKQPEPSVPPIVLPDNEYVWFVVHEPTSPKASIQRVLQTAAKSPVKAGDFSLKLDVGEKIGAWDAYGDWIWLLSNKGLYRMGRLWPVEGDSERFEPELIKAQIIGREPAGIVVDDTRLLIATERGLYVFDRHTRDLFQVGIDPIKKFTRTPYGIIAQTTSGFLYTDTSHGLPNMVAMHAEETDDAQALAQNQNFLMADAFGDSLIAVRPDRSILQMNPDNLKLNFSKTETIRDARLFGGRFWLLTSQRLISWSPDSGETQQYDIATVEMVNADLSIQAGVLKCGPITVTADNNGFYGQVIKLQSGPQGGTQVVTTPLGLVTEKPEESIPLSQESPAEQQPEINKQPTAENAQPLITEQQATEPPAQEILTPAAPADTAPEPQ